MARPRNAESDAAILAAASAVLGERGYDGLIVDEIARSVGVAKTTVYRRWPTKNHLVVSVLEDGEPDAAAADSGDDVRDLTSAVAALCSTLDPAPMRRLVAELAAASSRDPALRSEVDRLWARRRDAVAVVVERGVSAGTLSGDSALIVDQLVGAVYYRALITGETLDAEYSRGLVRAVVGPRDAEGTA
ncbi:AcrR family transcriptional regulator [Conyzicola lurida]|uniref:AcrR family transcriptional regulator n=1 Tax=Conyzicola lurida TaxID=1172621 RepID=A0A841AN45_9MICO|nr:TetR/AcrR family transcriptional regulator [Conyzicola lurida]MBB5843053.1 AcrR family transcriptional regulator [Conyzicola lurida]